MNKKYNLPNSYSEWTGREGAIVYNLMLNWRERFIWSNLLWISIVGFLISGKISVAVATFFVSLFLFLQLNIHFQIFD